MFSLVKVSLHKRKVLAVTCGRRFDLSQQKMLRLIANCPHCGETVEIEVTKREVKEMLKGFKLSLKEANLRSDDFLRRNWKAT